MLSSDFYCKENDGTTGTAHLIQTIWQKYQTLVVCLAPYSPDIRRIRNLANHRSLEFFFNVNKVRCSSRSVIFLTMKIRREH